MPPETPAQSGWHSVEDHVIHRDATLGLRLDLVTSPTGETFSRRVVEYRKASSILAVNAAEEVLLLRHYRHGVGKLLWEIPAG